MTKKPLFWIAIALFSALSFFFSWKFFEQAFPTLSVDISMSRDEALSAAKKRAAELKLAPSDARTAVRFNNDSEAQNFIELEAGGKQVFVEMLKKDIYQSLQWEVRFFREKDAAVTVLFFTPQGKPYGFVRHVPEAQPGAALTVDQAQSLAQQAALRDWGIDLTAGKSPYVLVEKSFENRQTGRVDHHFVYERSDQRLGKNGEGRVRLELRVVGDQLSTLNYLIKVPESFARRFAEMRSANSTIAATASLAMAVLYIVGGCLIGLLILRRQRFVISRPAIKWAGAIALLQGVLVLNQIPSAWFQYDTAIAANDFIAQQVGMAFAAFLGMWLLLAVSFMAAESLSRKAFGHHPQLWRLWTQGAGNSWDVLGRTVGGYLWVGFDLSFIVIFYYVTQHYLNWWSPLESLVDPNILAEPMPWLTPVANSLQAGFWEECLFRAVPLAGAALIGDYVFKRFNGRFGGRKTWLVIGLIVQALIFGAAHANYAQQPSYARPVELFIPAVMWGLVYLRFGLLPGIVFHFVFDLLLMSLPLFATSASGLMLDRVIVIVVGLTPLLIVLWSRVRAGQWQVLPENFFNAAWRVQTSTPVVEESLADTPTSQKIWQRARVSLPVLGAIGVVAWLSLSEFKQDALPLYIERAQAETAADAALKARGIVLSSEWHRFSQITQGYPGEDFIWREGGAEAYKKLLGSFLSPPRWKVRYVRFSGEVADRAEEWLVVVENGIDGKAGQQAAPHIRLIEHELPEARAGKSLTVEQARDIAQSALLERFQRQASTMREVTAKETVHPNRRDWDFEFADEQNFPLKTGEARFQILISGDEVSYIGRTIHVPEEWERAERERHSRMTMVKVGVGLLFSLLTLGIFILAIIRSEHWELNRRSFIAVAFTTFLLSLLTRLNGWQDVAMGLSTKEPLSSQLWILVIAQSIGLVLMALLVGMVAGFAVSGAKYGKLGSSSLCTLFLPGIGLAGVMMGISAVIEKFAKPEMPEWHSLTIMNQIFATPGVIGTGVLRTIIAMSFMTFLLILLRDFNANFSKRKLATLLIIFLVGFGQAMDATELTEFLMQGIGGGCIIMLLYVLVVRFEPKVVLIAFVTLSMVGQLTEAFYAPYPNAMLHALLRVAAMIGAMLWWLSLLEVKAESSVVQVV